MSTEEKFDSGTSKANRPKKNRSSINIEFARGLCADQLETILQHELLRARAATPPQREISIPTEIAHEIKYRLIWYFEKYGEVEGADDDD